MRHSWPAPVRIDPPRGRTDPDEVLQVPITSLVQALRPKAIQHPAHLNWINQFDATH